MSIQRSPSSYNQIIQIIFWLVFVIPLFFNPIGYFPFEITKVSFFFLFTGVLLLLGVLKYFGSNSFTFFSNKKFTLFLGAFILVILLSNIFSVSPVESFWGSYSHLQGTLYYLFLILWFVICLQLFHKNSNLEFFHKLTCFIALPICLFAFTQALHLPWLDYGSLAEFSFRPISTIGNPTMLGQWLIFPIIIAFFQQQKKDRHRWLYLTILFSSIIALLLTQNRASILALLIVAVIMGFLNIPKRHIKYRIGFALFTLLVMLGGIFLGFINPRSIISRFIILQDATSYLLNSPPLGRGLETLTQTSQQFITPQVYQTEPLFSQIDRLHNQPLQILNDWGWLGLILFIGLAVELFRKRSHSPEFYLLFASTLTLLFSFSFSAQHIYLIAALAVFCIQNYSFKKVKIALPNVIKLCSIFGSAIIFMFAVYYSYALNYSNFLLAKAEQVYEISPENSATLFIEAQKILPTYRLFYDRYWQFFSDSASPVQLQSVLSSYQQFSNNQHLPLYQAALDFRNSDFNSGRQKLAKLAVEKPNWPLLWQNWGDLEFQNKQYAEAILAYRHLQELAPAFWSDTNSESGRIYLKSNPRFYLSMYKLNLAQKYINP